MPTLLSLPLLAVRSSAAIRYGRRHAIPGFEFAVFGRRVGAALLKRGIRRGLRYWLSPVSIVRYFEFGFAAACIPSNARDCLDVASPRLLSLFLCARSSRRRILMVNPDAGDIAETEIVRDSLGLWQPRTRRVGVDFLRLDSPAPFDCIWSISVIEHIAGGNDDRSAVELMYRALRPGGRLILTFPVDRAYREQFRDESAYDAESVRDDRGVFFQRRYDESAIRERLIDSVGVEPTRVAWFGERVAGHYDDYVRRWQREGLRCTVSDPREIADHFCEYDSWTSMPGMGVCGLMFERSTT